MPLGYPGNPTGRAGMSGPPPLGLLSTSVMRVASQEEVAIVSCRVEF
jgi:hypothetical protein